MRVVFSGGGGMPLNGKFVEKYGLSWKDMDNDARLMAIMSEIFDLSESVEPVPSMCKIVEKHETWWKIAGVIITAFAVALIGLFVKVIFHL